MTRVADLLIGVFQPFRLLLGDALHATLGHRPRWDGFVQQPAGTAHRRR